VEWVGERPPESACAETKRTASFTLTDVAEPEVPQGRSNAEIACSDHVVQGPVDAVRVHCPVASGHDEEVVGPLVAELTCCGVRAPVALAVPEVLE